MTFMTSNESSKRSATGTIFAYSFLFLFETEIILFFTHDKFQYEISFLSFFSLLLYD